MNIDGETSVYAVLGDPVRHSRSPGIWNHLFEQAGIPAVYVALPVPRATEGATLCTSLRTLGLRGANLTIPHKERVLPFLDHLSPTARACGAVNWISIREQRLHGDNTDGEGFLWSLHQDHRFSVSDQRVVVLGTGGAGRAVIASALLAGAAHVTALNRTEQRARQVVTAIRRATGVPEARSSAGPLTPEAFAAAVSEADLVVSCVSGPGAEALAALPVDAVPVDAIWSDLNYWMDSPPGMTAHRIRGGRTQDGWSMLIGQAVVAFGRETGRDVDGRAILSALSTRRAAHPW